MTFFDMFLQDPIANSIAVIVLLVMVFSIVWIGYLFLKGSQAEEKYTWPAWAVPALTLAGMGIAAYLTYVEFTHIDAVCGPVGDCNTVQTSPYAYLLGILPVGLFGLIGYIAVAFAWLIGRFGPGHWHPIALVAMWGLALVGTLFSIYLTFLEPFVIGATCAWCILSAMVMTLLLWATTPPAMHVMSQLPEEVEV